jgi:uncharacterized damage-inducible protein DinB
MNAQRNALRCEGHNKALEPTAYSFGSLRSACASGGGSPTALSCKIKWFAVKHTRSEGWNMTEVAQAFIDHSRRLLLEHYLPRIERCLERLSDEELWWRANPECTSVGNLLLHLAGNVRQWVISGLGGATDRRQRQQEFDERAPIPREALLNSLKQTVEEAAVVLARVSPHSLPERRQIQGSDVTVLEAIYHVVEHFSMHTGQIILQTKLLAGGDLAFYDFSSGVPRATWGGEV